MKHITVRQGDEFYCTHCHRRWSRDESEPLICERTQSSTVNRLGIAPAPAPVTEEYALIALLTARLGMFEPKSETYKRGMSYLERNK